MRHINRLIIHCAASPNGLRLGSHAGSAAQVIDRWHAARKFSRRDPVAKTWNPHLLAVGYHWIIDVDGTVNTGRHENEVGAHAVGYNIDSLAVCMVGTDKFSVDQWAALRDLVAEVRRKWPIVQVLGHRDLPDVHKTCPGFDVADWETGGRAALPGHIWRAPE